MCAACSDLADVKNWMLSPSLLGFLETGVVDSDDEFGDEDVALACARLLARLLQRTCSGAGCCPSWRLPRPSSVAPCLTGVHVFVCHTLWSCRVRRRVEEAADARRSGVGEDAARGVRPRD